MGERGEAIRDARKLGVPKMLILGLQHMFAMFGATILVPILVNSYFVQACGEPLTTGLTVSVTLFGAGFGTLLFHVCSKFKVPAFLGSSFAFLGGFSTVANLNSGMYASMGANEKAAYACGGVVVAGLFYLIFALIIRIVGVKRVMRYLPACCNRTGYHLYRFKSCRLCNFQCIHKLVSCTGCSCSYHCV